MPLVYDEQTEEFLSNHEVPQLEYLKESLKIINETQHSPSSTTHSIRHQAGNAARHAMDALATVKDTGQETIDGLRKFANQEGFRKEQ